jgi:hypothetical protein
LEPLENLPLALWATPAFCAQQAEREEDAEQHRGSEGDFTILARSIAFALIG